MEPNQQNFAPPTELPQPHVPEASTNSPEITAAPEAQPLPPTQPTVSQPTGMGQPMAQASTASPLTGSSPTQSSTQQLIADDADLIEKEWVHKAKAIVAQTKDDPYRQNQEMTKVKADYLKKRYNKDLKASEG